MTESILSPEMLELLRCPCPSHASMTFLSATGGDPASTGGDPASTGGNPASTGKDQASAEGHPTSDGELVCDECRRVFPIRDGIPVMLLDEASEPSD